MDPEILHILTSQTFIGMRERQTDRYVVRDREKGINVVKNNIFYASERERQRQRDRDVEREYIVYTV